MQTMSSRASWWMSIASFAWVWGLLSVAWPTRYLLCLGLALVFGLTTWVSTRWPWPGVFATAAGLVVLGLLGIGTDQPAPLGPLFVVLVTVGYLAVPRWSVLAVPVLLVATALPARWDPASVLFGGGLLVLPWWFGLRIRLRDDRRRRAAADARRLAKVDPRALARQAAATERESVAASAFEVIGRAVEHMTGSAVAARGSLAADEIEAIRRKGEEATQQLRALLVLLRQEPPSPEPEDVGPEQEPETPRRPRWLQLLVDGWPALLILLDVTTMAALTAVLTAQPLPDPPTASFLLLTVLPLMVAVVLRDRLPVTACLLAALTLVVGSVSGIADVGRDGVWLMIAAVAISWAAGRTGTSRSLVAWLVFANTLGYVVFVDTPHYLPIYLGMCVLPFGAGAVWSGHHAEETAHMSRAHLRQAEIDAAEREAVSRERITLARELHDAASHAVGTMMMQANAALVLRERDPDGARSALDAVADIGAEAAQELRSLGARVDPGTTGDGVPGAGSGGAPAGEVGGAPAARPPGSGAAPGLAQALAPLVTAARRTGGQVLTSLDLADEPSPEDSVLILRIVREGLANAARHAPGSDVRIAVDITAGRVRVVVANGPSAPDPGHDGAVLTPMGLGLGLRGLRELVGERQGELVTGPAPDGYELTARFPRHTPHRPPQTAPSPAVPR